jgi:hypothetical protein
MAIEVLHRSLASTEALERLIELLLEKEALRRLLTGVPGFSTISLIDHAVGTASYFLEAGRVGPREALRELLRP